MFLISRKNRSATLAAATELVKSNSTRDDNADESEVAVLAPEDNRPVERLVILRQSLPLVSTVCARRLLATGLVRLDVGGVELGDSGLGTIVAWTPWLRELCAAGSSVRSLCQGPLRSTALEALYNPDANVLCHAKHATSAAHSLENERTICCQIEGLGARRSRAARRRKFVRHPSADETLQVWIDDPSIMT